MEQELKNTLILTTNLALLSGIGTDLLGISLSIEDDLLIMNVFSNVELDENQIDWLEAATTEMLTQLWDIFSDVRLKTHIIEGKLLPRTGLFVFCRLGIGWQ